MAVSLDDWDAVDASGSSSSGSLTSTGSDCVLYVIELNPSTKSTPEIGGTTSGVTNEASVTWLSADRVNLYWKALGDNPGTVAWEFTANNQGVHAGIVSGVDQTTPFTTVSTQIDDTFSKSPTDVGAISTTGELVVSAMYHGGTSNLASSQTAAGTAAHVIDTSFVAGLAAASYNTGGTSLACDYGGALGGYALLVFGFAEASGGGGSTIPVLAHHYRQQAA